ncbi:nematocin receptor 2 [Octopus bimaculoides]|uniref:G-protein coupled receptors family 1 profile domain-containing protein n=1 Tax=Octopus bimaculoides TaxID=37653 RepID=A0A0L8HTH5_OCTBM|nr:nematocin receptor 2 [Octopus bimaculoides]|eukprot:XP_014769525.1 PREDICTED: neuromedin-U receptor 1-like [Octopus bimaculoides]
MSTTSSFNDLTDEQQLLRISKEKVHDFLLAIIYLGVAMIMGVIGNAFVSYIYHYKLRPTPANLFVVILSFCDFLASLICIPMDISILTHPYVFESDPACRVIRFFVMDLSITSGVIVFAISIDRFKKVCLPLKKQFSRRQVGIISAVVIIFATVLSLPSFYVYGTKHFTIPGTYLNGSICSISEKAHKSVSSGFLILLMSICLLLLITFSTIYCLIAIKLCRYKKQRISLGDSMKVKSVSHDDNSREMTDSNDYIKENRRIDKIQKSKAKGFTLEKETFRVRSNTQTSRREPTSFMNMTRTTLIMFFVTLTWVLSYIPHLASVLILSRKPEFKETLNPTNSALFEIALRSFYLNNMINPFIYGIFNFRFRNEVVVLLRKTFCCLKLKPSS